MMGILDHLVVLHEYEWRSSLRARGQRSSWKPDRTAAMLGTKTDPRDCGEAFDGQLDLDRCGPALAAEPRGE
jgi:hypothetical protein